MPDGAITGCGRFTLRFAKVFGIAKFVFDTKGVGV